MEEVKKVSAWTEAELEGKPVPPAAPIIIPPPLPAWLTTFPPGTLFNVNGWDCAVRHVGQEEGHWLMLVEPVRCTQGVMSRSEYRRLKAQIGKKKVKKILKERK